MDRFKGGRTEKAKEDHLNAFHAGCHYVVLKTLPKSEWMPVDSPCDLPVICLVICLEKGPDLRTMSNVACSH